MAARYGYHLAAAAGACAACAGCLTLRMWTLHPAALLAGWVYGVAFPTLVVIRLPLFRAYLRRDALNALAWRRPRSTANDKAAMALASVMAGASMAALWAGLAPDLAPDLGPDAVTDAALCAAIAAGVITHYHLDAA